MKAWRKTRVEALALGQLQAAVEVLQQAVDADVGAEAHEVQRAAGLPGVVDGRVQLGVLEELAVADRPW